MRELTRGILLVAVLLRAAAAAAQAPPAAAGTIAGRVRDAAGAPVAGATVTLAETGARTSTDAEGGFRLEGVPPGTVHLRASSPRLGSVVRELAVEAGRETAVELRVDPLVHEEEIVVTASVDARGAAEIVQPVGVLDREQLDRRMQPTLGETLAREPGIASTGFGPGASRPVIRGLGGDRVRVLEGGLGTGDLASISPDHAVSVDPASAERIETVRGPATLLYGGNAIGGVVNVIDRRIPDALPEAAVTGTAELALATGAAERGGSSSLQGAAGPVAWHVNALKRRTDDYSAPGSAAGSEESLVEVRNSDLDSEGATLGLSWVGGRGHLGASFGGLDTNYGRPIGVDGNEEGGEGEGEEGEEEGPVRIDLRQRRLDLRGELRPGGGPLRALRARAGRTDYRHRELEGEEVGTTFHNDSWEGRVEALHRAWHGLAGAVGVQLGRREFEAVGEESLVPPTRTTSAALFLFEELGSGDLRLQLGGRWERARVRPDAAELSAREFDGLSGSAGLVWLHGEGWSAAAAVARSVKAPAAEELFSNGPHDATGSFEIGDPGLDDESSVGLDVSLRKRTGVVTGELNLFTNRFAGFIFPRFTGEEREELPVLRFSQADASHWGAEAHVDVELLHAEPHHLTLEGTADYVRATLRETDEPLPLIPPFRAAAALDYREQRWSARLELRRVEEQDRVAALESRTPGHTMLDASLGYRFFTKRTVHDLRLRATNLGNELGRNHVSLLKEAAPLPGRDLRLSYRVSF